MKIKTLIVDDEPFVRQDLSNLLLSHENIHVTGEAGTISEARQQLTDHHFDLIFLDIRLRGGSGFDLIPFIDKRSKIVFVTGYNSYALKAFEINAMDYLLKPVSKDRLASTLGRIRQIENQNPPSDENSRVFVKQDIGGRYVTIKDIAAITSIGGNYLTILLTRKEKLVCRNTLKYWETVLPENAFFRIHRSVIVNLEQIETILPAKGGVLKLKLLNHQNLLTVSRRNSIRLKDKFGGRFA
jgi:two-component system LytT family response regulator